MTTGYDAPMNKASDMVRIALDGLAAGDYEVITDDLTASVKQGLSDPIGVPYTPSSPRPLNSSPTRAAPPRPASPSPASWVPS